MPERLGLAATGVWHCQAVFMSHMEGPFWAVRAVAADSPVCYTRERRTRQQPAHPSGR